MKTRVCLVILLIGLEGAALAQFSSTWLQDPLWDDGNAEFNTYDAQQMRYGVAHQSEVTHIFVREHFSPKELVKTEDGSMKGAYPVLKLNQILHVPTGVYRYQQMHAAYWDARDGSLVKANLTSNDSCGNTWKELRALSGWRGWFGSGWRLQWHTYWEGMSNGEETVTPPASGVFYDELPMRVRMIDFSQAAGEFTLPIAPTIISSKHAAAEWTQATFRWKRLPETIEVSVTRGEKADTFLLSAKPPHVIQAWNQSDGGALKLRRSLRFKYWLYNKPGDEERLTAELASGS